MSAAKARKEREEEQYRRANSVHKQAPAQSAERQAIEERLVAEAQERDNRVAMLRAEKRKGEEAACQPKPTCAPQTILSLVSSSLGCVSSSAALQLLCATQLVHFFCAAALGNTRAS